MKQNYKDILSEIRRAVKEKGWTHEQLAEKLGRKQQAISRALKGDVRPSIELVVEMANAVGLKVELNEIEEE